MHRKNSFLEDIEFCQFLARVFDEELVRKTRTLIPECYHFFIYIVWALDFRVTSNWQSTYKRLVVYWIFQFMFDWYSWYIRESSKHAFNWLCVDSFLLRFGGAIFDRTCSWGTGVESTVLVIVRIAIFNCTFTLSVWQLLSKLAHKPAMF